MDQLSKEDYDPFIEEIVPEKSPVSPVRASVIVVAYQTNWDLIACLESLQKQTCQDFETLLIDNGGNEAVLETLASYSLTYIRLKQNYQPSLARNIGIAYARGEVCCFLDDDALAHPDYVAAHLAAYGSGRSLGVRGRILPKTSSLYNALATHYDLGERVVPAYIDTENNASFRRSVLLAVGGFHPAIFAGEGAELSYRISLRSQNPVSLIYSPGPVIYHDFANSLSKYLRKTVRGAQMRAKLEKAFPAFWSYIESYHPLPGGEIQRQTQFFRRIHLAFLRRLGRIVHQIALAWYKRQEERKALPGEEFPSRR